MSHQHVQAFYAKLAQDEAFCDKIKNVSSKEECRRIVKAAGFYFTQQEFEDYTAQILEKDPDCDDEIIEIGERELEAVHGGFLNWRNFIMIYGGPPTRDLEL